MQIRNKVFVITGAASGIGAALARQIVELGGKVVLGDLQLDKLKDLADELNKGNEKKAAYTACNVRHPTQIRALFELAEHEFDGIDVVCNNAGVFDDEFYENEDKWRVIVDINLNGVIAGTQIGIEYLQKRGGGVIINTSSMAANAPSPMVPVYNATKGAIQTFTQSLAHLKKECNIRINSVAPYAVNTPLIHSFYKKNINFRKSIDNMGTVAIEDVVNGFIYIVENEELVGDIVQVYPSVPLRVMPRVHFINTKTVLADTSRLLWGLVKGSRKSKRNAKSLRNKQPATTDE